MGGKSGGRTRPNKTRSARPKKPRTVPAKAPTPSQPQRRPPATLTRARRTLADVERATDAAATSIDTTPHEGPADPGIRDQSFDPGYSGT